MGLVRGLDFQDITITIMHASYSLIFTLLAVSTARPTIPPNINARADLASESNPKMDPSNILGEILDLFEETCHNTCMQIYPQEGPKQENCMTICRELSHPLYSLNDLCTNVKMLTPEPLDRPPLRYYFLGGISSIESRYVVPVTRMIL
ncbi:hypothetical protein F4820DRAFT_286483 [Hypoxylon rubiginosum]|uniref:Uncharacterized protein n=1 Tax=Hypoxylon rubiginosum TaxID=110542 RepID=A0ACB9ZEA5_9PEZI|nr:hypothetical protein F4820DRAFT_286483 [Hypoxylon rubiginosum]